MITTHMVINLIDSLEEYIEKKSLLKDDYVYRVSMIQDYERVKKFGSSRIGISEKLWNRNQQLLEDYSDIHDEIKKYKGFPLKHEDVIIGSFWNDLREDAYLDNSTLKHKMMIYQEPFITIYQKAKLLYLFPETGMEQNNQGKNFLFKDTAINCLVDIVFFNQLILKDRHE